MDNLATTQVQNIISKVNTVAADSGFTDVVHTDAAKVAADITTPVYVDIMIPEACGPGMESISGAKSRMQARLT